MTAPRPVVEVAAIIRAPRELVFDAWLTPARLGAFLCAGDSHVAGLEIDPRVGGEFRVVMSSERGSFEHRGRFLEIDRPRRLRFTWASEATHGLDTTVSITFEPIEGGTRVALVHEGLSDSETAARHQGGWASILTKCAGAVELRPA
jgi:uncharacterized protein YndB with AHSA1/START domain